jgi:hypothetical protein
VSIAVALADKIDTLVGFWAIDEKPTGSKDPYALRRAALGVSRLSMPDAATARQVTGYERGTITPFGSTTAWPVVADRRLAGRQITLGAGRKRPIEPESTRTTRLIRSTCSITKRAAMLPPSEWPTSVGGSLHV